MKRHPFNIFTLMFGVVLILLAAWATWFTFPARGWVFDASRWFLPAAAILIGAALLIPLFTNRVGKTAPADEPESDDAGSATEPPPDLP